MKISSRPTQWLLTWVVLGLLLATGFGGAVFFRPLMVAVGAERTGAPSTIAPTIFSPPPVVVSEPPIGNGLVPPAEPLPPGRLPAVQALTARLAALDTVALRKDPTKPVTNAFEVIDLETGGVLAASGATAPLIPASNTKLLTTTAVLNAFEGNERFATRVLEPTPGQVVLVGGGDPLLTSVPVKAGTYPRPPSLQELATATAAALKKAGRTSVTLGYDATLFTDPGWNRTWPSNYHDQVTTLSALWADEGRDAKRVRSRTPALLAATTFAAQLTAAGVTVTGAPVAAKGSGTELARVESLPVHVLAEQAMLRSNNSFTEVLGFQLALKTGQPATFAGSVAAIKAELTDLGLWSAGAVLHDASGLSRDNRVTAGMLAATVRRASQEAKLSVILDGFPVAGVTGTLSDRFADPIARPARGVAKAKTGTLSLVATLAGVTTTADGREVAYAFMTNGSPDGWAAKVWTDQGVGVVSACGC